MCVTFILAIYLPTLGHLYSNMTVRTKEGKSHLAMMILSTLVKDSLEPVIDGCLHANLLNENRTTYIYTLLYCGVYMYAVLLYISSKDWIFYLAKAVEV